MLINKKVINKKVDITYRISLAETDSVGVVYFANYFVFFEKGHQEFLRQAGINNAELIKSKIYLPIKKANCEFKIPLYYDDLINISTSLKQLEKTYLEFNYEIIRTQTNELAATGFTQHLFANHAFQITRIPSQIENTLKKL